MFNNNDKIKIIWEVGKKLPLQKAVGIVIERKPFGNYRIKITKSQSTLFIKNKIYIIPQKYIKV